MKLVRIDHLAPEGAQIQLHPQLTILRGATPEMRRKLIQIFQAFSTPENLECSGVIEVGGVQLSLDQLTLQGLELDPLVRAVLNWVSAVPLATPDATAVPYQSDPGASFQPDRPGGLFPAPLHQAESALPQQRVDQNRQDLQRVDQNRRELVERMEQVREGLDALAAGVLEGCRSQIEALEARRAVLRADWEYDRAQVQSRRDEIQAEMRALTEKLDMVATLDLSAVVSVRDELRLLLATTLVPDPVAQDLAVRIYNSLRNLREISDLAVAATSRRIEAEQSLNAAQDDVVSSTSASLSPAPDPDDLRRLEELRLEIFSYPSTVAFPEMFAEDSASAQPYLSLQDLRTEEARLLHRLGYESYSAYVRGIPLVQTDLERTSRRESALLRVQQYEQELQQLIAGSPDPQDLELAEMELTVMLQAASELLGDRASFDPGVQSLPEQPLSAATDAQRADNVREVVALLRERKIASVIVDSPEVLLVADRLRETVERAAGPGLNDTWMNSEDWSSDPQALLQGVDLWLAVFQDPADWVASTRSQIHDLRAQIAAGDAQDLYQGDVTQWAEVEADLDSVMDVMVDAQNRVARHEQAMLQLAALRDEELQLRSQERDLLATLAQAESELQQAQLHSATAFALPPAQRSGIALRQERTHADDCEWLLIERVAQQRAVSFSGSVPLLIDGLPSDPLAQHQVIERVKSLSSVVQLLILSDNPWLFEQVQLGKFSASALQL
ncbi:MAG: hypothetical protein WCJ04_05300 [Actinomycetes bacterium]